MRTRSTRKRDRAPSPPSRDQQAIQKRLKREAPERPALPAELWLQIAKKLAPSDLASLSLASRSHYNFIGEHALSELRRPNQHQERLKFLFHAYEFFPGRTFCAGCNTYHDTERLLCENPEENVYNDKWPLYFSENFSLQWPQLYARAQQLRLKQLEEVPLMEERKDPVFDAYKSEVTGGWCVRVWYGMDPGNRILFCIQYQQAATVDILQKPRDIRLPWMCMHCVGAPQLSEQVELACKVVPRPWEANELLCYKSPVFGCTLCASEFVVEATPLNNPYLEAQLKATHNIVLYRFMDLGEGLTPHSREWVAATSGYKDDVLELRPFDQQGRPSILERFHKIVETAYRYIVDGGSAKRLYEIPCLPELDDEEDRRPTVPLLTETTDNHLKSDPRLILELCDMLTKSELVQVLSAIRTAITRPA